MARTKTPAIKSNVPCDFPLKNVPSTEITGLQYWNPWTEAPRAKKKYLNDLSG